MNRYFSGIFYLLLLFAVCENSFAQKARERGLSAISADNARNYVSFLADDFLQGRGAGTEGGRMAAAYIVSLLSDWGVEPLFDNGYYQSFETVKSKDSYLKKWEISPDSVSVLGKKAGYEVNTLNNILAVIPGKSNDEMVIIGAHYDHMGFDFPVKGDSCYNGADDNASGVSAVLQIAKAMKLSGVVPRRTVVFAFWDGEERGLLGSRHFVSTMCNNAKVKAYMNFDMIGRGPKSNPAHLSYFYSAANPAFGEWLRCDCEKYNFCFQAEYRPSENLNGGSDNASFAQLGVPIVWYHTEGHSDYHMPSDIAGKIDYPKLTDITRAAYLCAWRLANEKSY